MTFAEVAEFLRKRGYSDYEIKDHYRVFYEFDKMDFLYNDCAKKYDVEYADGIVIKITMTQFWFGKTEIRELKTFEELQNSL